MALPQIQYGITSFGYSNPGDACTSLNPTIRIYAEPSYTTPMVGMVFYADPSLIIPYNGGFMAQWYLL